jgi:hypothetical protein
MSRPVSILRTPHYIDSVAETNKQLIVQAMNATPCHLFKARLVRFSLNCLAILLWMLGPSIYSVIMIRLAPFMPH